MWVLAQGPGIPMVLVTVFSWSISQVLRRRAWQRPTVGLAIVAAFVIDFLLLTCFSQHEKARFFQPLMPIVALGIVRMVQRIDVRPLRAAVALTVAGLGIDHLVALTFISETRSSTVFLKSVPLWDHQPYFTMVLNFLHGSVDEGDAGIPATMALLRSQELRPGSVVAILTPPQPFFSANGLQFQAVREGVDLTFVTSDFIDPTNPASAAEVFPDQPVDALLFWSDPRAGIDSNSLAPIVPVLFDARVAGFEKVGAEVRTATGTIRLYRARTPPWKVDSPFWSDVRWKADGSVTLIANPTPASARNPTRVVLSSAPAGRVRISAKVSFYDRRCAGAEIDGVESDRARTTLGVFSPAMNDAVVSWSPAGIEGASPALEIRAGPTSPEKIDYCALQLKNLNVERLER